MHPNQRTSLTTNHLGVLCCVPQPEKSGNMLAFVDLKAADYADAVGDMRFLVYPDGPQSTDLTAAVLQRDNGSASAATALQ